MSETNVSPTERWAGKVHDFNSPTALTTDRGEIVIGCGDIQDGHKCGRPEQSRVHQFIASPSCWTPFATVEIYHGGAVGVHLASFGWLREDDGSWFSGWYRSHNKPGTWLRADQLDCKSSSQIGPFIQAAAAQAYDEITLVGMGMKLHD
jgi:hypothetical protein